MRLAAILLFGLIGCATTAPNPFFQDARYLRFGVDPNEEANAVIESQKARSLVLAQRQLGRNFTALSFMDKGGRSTAVRILTARGIAIALDSRAASPLEPAMTYALLAAPIAGTFDADKDGFEEVFIEERTPDETCLRPYRVRDVGFVDQVVVESRVWGAQICPRAVVDLDGDGVVELVTEVELAGFSGIAAAPRMPLPLWADQHRFVSRAGTAPQRAWIAGERTRREAELERARQKRDVAQSYALGIELAALAHLGGADPTAQLAAFDRALRGLVLSPPQAAANLSARGRIFTTWNEPAALPEPGKHTREAASAVATDNPPKRAQPEGPNASKVEPADERSSADQGIPVRRIRRGRSAPLPEPEPAPFWARQDGDQPALADGEFIITPASAGKVRKSPAPPQPSAAPAPASTQPAAAPAQPAAVPRPLPPDRDAARELGNAAFAARKRASEARHAAAAERSEAQAARVRAGQAGDPALAAEHRKVVAEHVAAAERLAAEAEAHAAEAEKHRNALIELKSQGTAAPAAQ